MMISTKGRYALRLMADLALNDDGSYISLRDVSYRQNISVKYLEQIVGVLCKTGCIVSARGAKGGYRLSKRPEDYIIGDILRITEGGLSPVACLSSTDNDCPRSEYCLTVGFWQGLYDVINEYVDSMTLADIAKVEAETWETAM